MWGACGRFTGSERRRVPVRVKPARIPGTRPPSRSRIIHNVSELHGVKFRFAPIGSEPLRLPPPREKGRKRNAVLDLRTSPRGEVPSTRHAPRPTRATVPPQHGGAAVTVPPVPGETHLRARRARVKRKVEMSRVH